MARANFNDVAIDTTGAALSGVQVTVIDTESDDNAAIYTGMTGGGFKTNPFNTTSNGVIDFKVQPGSYRIDLHDSQLPARFSDRSLYFEGVSGDAHGILLSQLDLSGISGDIEIAAGGAATIQPGRVDTTELANAAVTAPKLGLGYGITTIDSDVNLTGGTWQDVISLVPNPATFLFIASVTGYNRDNSDVTDIEIRFKVGTTPSDALGACRVAANDLNTVTAAYIATMNGTAAITVQAIASLPGLGTPSSNIHATPHSTLTRLMIG